jgi:galactonate dehydratase
MPRETDPVESFLLYLEEPVLPGDVAGMKQVSSATSIPIATGERLFTRWQFNDLIEAQAVAIIQPDISHCGGIFETRKIASMAEARNIAVAPHCPLGPIALACSLQLDACTPNFLCQEHRSLGHDYFKVPFEVRREIIYLEVLVHTLYIGERRICRCSLSTWLRN